MTVTVKGIYRDGRIELSEKPPAVADGREVIVTIQAKKPPQPVQRMHFGMLAKPGAPMSSWEDFQERRNVSRDGSHHCSDHR